MSKFLRSDEDRSIINKITKDMHLFVQGEVVFSKYDNDIVLDNGSVSRYHAELVFNGSGFDIVDKGSTNKVIVNGVFQSRAALKNGDIIGLGEAVITFYL